MRCLMNAWERNEAKSRVQRARKRLREKLAAACQVKFDAGGKVCCFTQRGS